MHTADENKAAPEVFAQLLAAWPEAAREKDVLGSLPLHQAATFKAALECQI